MTTPCKLRLIVIGMRIQIAYKLKFLRGKLRLKHGFCPMCNSDAPELYSCPCCNYYSSASGDKFPPLKPTKARWWNTYHEAISAKKNIQVLVLKARKDKSNKAA